MRRRVFSIFQREASMASHFSLRALVLASAALAVAALPASAQRADPSRIIDFHLNAERSNVSLDGSVKEGGRFRLTTPDRATYALSFVQLDAARRLFAVTVFRGGGMGDTTTYRALETVHATIDVPVPLPSLPYVTVVIEGTRTAQASTADVPLVSLTAYTRHVTGMFDDYCCVSCDGWIACGCGVSMSCGSCCVGECCKRMPAPPPGGDGLVRYFPDRPLRNGGRRCKEVPVDERLYPALYSTERIASR
jgi:hypothetical protein